MPSSSSFLAEEDLRLCCWSPSLLSGVVQPRCWTLGEAENENPDEHVEEEVLVQMVAPAETGVPPASPGSGNFVQASRFDCLVKPDTKLQSSLLTVPFSFLSLSFL